MSGSYADAFTSWMRNELPKAIEWAEADLLSLRRARRIALTVAVEAGRCAVGHEWRDRPVHGCGYCANAAEHEHMWQPPDPATRAFDVGEFYVPEAPTADGRKVWL